ncbi:MAG: M28 family metallopeptidase [Victivallaceae bacterium]|nr:M28 family metallopeptidase [Victivallaceae bacterium]
MRKLDFCFIAAVLFMLAGCGPGEIKVPDFDERNALRLLTKLVAFGPRSSGTTANLRQAEFIAATAGNYGAVTSCQKFQRLTEAGPLRFINVEAVIPGRQPEFIILGSHFDTKKLPGRIKFEGANDGASSTALLLELIRAIKNSGMQLEYTLKFVFFDGEECFSAYSFHDGLFGSKYYARQLELERAVFQCRAVIIFDMVGDKDLNITLPADSDQRLAAMLFRAARRAGTAAYFGYLPTPLVDDHAPFQKLGIPVLDVIDFDFGPANSFWHTSEDNTGNIAAASLKIIGQTALNLIFYENFAKKF